MREIKFRAWDKINRKFVRINDIVFYPNGTVRQVSTEYMEYGDNEEDNNEFDLSDLVLVQYTGLKDKNGVEIYEGDIVKNRGYEELCIVEFYQGQYIGRYKPQDRFYQLDESLKVTEQRGLHYIGLSFYVKERNSIEVIGNIYENPELLEGTAP